MPKTRALAFPRSFSPSAPMMVVSSRGGRIRRGASRVGAVARRAGRRAGSLARRGGREHLPVVGIAIGGALVGLADARGLFNRLPAIGGSRALTLAGVGYAATRFFKNPTIRMAGLAAVAAAAFDFGKVHGAPGGGGRSESAEAPLAPAGKKPGAHGVDDDGAAGHDDASGNQGDGGPY